VISRVRVNLGHCNFVAVFGQGIRGIHSPQRDQGAMPLGIGGRNATEGGILNAVECFLIQGEKGVEKKGSRKRGQEKGVRKKGSGANLDKISHFPNFSACQGACVLNFPVPITTKGSGGYKKIASAEAGSSGASLERDDGFAGMDRGQAVNAQPREHEPAAATAGSRKEPAQGAARDAEFF